MEDNKKGKEYVAASNFRCNGISKNAGDKISEDEFIKLAEHGNGGLVKHADGSKLMVEPKAIHPLENPPAEKAPNVNKSGSPSSSIPLQAEHPLEANEDGSAVEGAVVSDPTHSESHSDEQQAGAQGQSLVGKLLHGSKNGKKKG